MESKLINNIMNTNEKGNIGLVEVIRALVKLDYECFLPIHDYSAVDLIVVKKDKTFRLQVKYRKTKKGRIEIPLSSVVNGRTVPIDMSLIDGFAVYCPEIDHVVFIHKSEIDSKMINFRLEPSKYKSTKIYTNFGKLDEWIMSAPC